MNETIAKLILATGKDKGVFPILADAFSEAGLEKKAELYRKHYDFILVSEGAHHWCYPEDVDAALDYLYSKRIKYLISGLSDKDFWQEIKEEAKDKYIADYLCRYLTDPVKSTIVGYVRDRDDKHFEKAFYKLQAGRASLIVNLKDKERRIHLAGRYREVCIFLNLSYWIRPFRSLIKNLEAGRI